MKLKGLYLVVDLSIEKDELLNKVEKALKGGVDILQVWYNWNDPNYAYEVSKDLLRLAKKHNALLLINGNYPLANDIGADGVHFDTYEITPDQVKKLNKNLIVGYTIGNDLNRAIWAEKVGADYISFCACFPTSTVTSCDIVPLEVVREAKNRLKIPVFASGGINLKNVEKVLETGVDGIAVISAILYADDPEIAARKFKEKLLEFSKQYQEEIKRNL